MQFNLKLCGVFVVFVALILGASTRAWADDRAAVLRLIEQAPAALKIPSSQDVSQAQHDAQAAAKSLETYLDGLPTGQIVQKSIALDDLAAQLQRAPADVSALTALAERLHNDRHSSPAQTALQIALDNYLDNLRAQANPGLAEEYKRRLNDLAEALRADSRQSSPESRARLREAYDRLPHVPGGWSLRMAVRRVISYPNQMLAASAPFLNEEASRQKVGMATPINKNSSGTSIRGNAETKGVVAVVLHPNDAEAELEIQFRGQTNARLTGSKGPVNVFERGQADLFASDVGYLSATNGVRTNRATAQAKSDIRPYGVQINLRCGLLRRIVTPIAWKAAWKQKASGDRQTEQEIEGQLKTEIAHRTENELQQVNQMFREYYPPTATEGSRAPRLHIYSTASHLYCGAEFAAPWQFGAPTPAPTIAGIDQALLMQVHESAINNNAGNFSGRTLNEPDFRELAFDMLALTPDEPNRQRGRVPAKVTLTERKPIEVGLQNGRVEITFHVNSFQMNGQSYAGLRTARVDYRPRIGAQGVEVVREGAVRVEPASVAGQPDLAALMAEALPQRATTEGPTTTGALGESHNLRVSHLSVADGWLNVAWEHDKSTPISNGPAADAVSTNKVQP